MPAGYSRPSCAMNPSICFHLGPYVPANLLRTMVAMLTVSGRVAKGRKMKLTGFWALFLVTTFAPAFASDDNRPAGVAGDTWQFGPLNRWTYTHIREILPTKDIPNASMHVRPIPGLAAARNDLEIELNGRTVQLSVAMKAQYVDGILVIRDGAAVAELYDGTLTPERTHLMWSVSKTVTGLTVASVAADGLIDLDKTVADYVPELALSGWANDRLRDLLDMKDTSDWNEDYDAPESTVRRQDCADGLLTGPMCLDSNVIGNYKFLPDVGHDESRKGKFIYKSGTTDVMAWVLEAATGKRFADIVSERIWKPIGAERSAGITVDVSGFTLASGGMFATLRDIARVGLLMINRGRAGDRQVVPAAWMDDVFGHEGDPEWPRAAAPGTDPYYRSFIWGVGDGKGTVMAQGVHGQFIYVSPSTDTVIAMFSTWPNADGGVPGVGHAGALAILQAVETAVR
jgi:6-aminohexanoate-oligomer exohydrolase